MKPSNLDAIKNLAKRRQALLEKVVDHSGADWCRLHTDIADEVVNLVFNDLCESEAAMPRLAVVATGGYGRQELAPYSDIDLTVIPMDEADPVTDAAVRTLFRDIHTAFGTELRMDVGYAFMLINDAPGLDAKTRTGLLDSRLVAGSSEPYGALMDLFWETIPVGEFLLSKIRERESAMPANRGTALVVEPDLKDGAGGLRSFQCANWLRAAIGEMPARPTKSYDRVLKMRNLLHGAAGKRQDTLTRARQAEIADATGQDVYRMMSALVEAGSELHDQYRVAKEKLLETRYPLADGVSAMRGEVRISGAAKTTEAAVGVAYATQLGLRVARIPTATEPGTEGPEALAALGAGEPTLRNLDRCGLLDVLIPELTRCRFLLPTDSSHDYTVFEHTMRVVRNLDSLPLGTFLGDLKNSLSNSDTLYLVALLHDIGKSQSEKSHSEAGAAMAREIGRRWRLAQETVDLVARLVEHHLTMSIFTRMRDVQNPATAAEFAQLVKTQEFLDLLTLLTWADTSAVAEGGWTPAQESFLRELHERTTAILQGEAAEEPDPAQYRRRLMRELRHEQESESEVEAFLGSLQTHYLLSTPPDVVRLHMQFARKAREGEPTVELFHQPEVGTTEVTVCCLDASGLLNKVLGSFYAFDLNLHSIRAATTQTEPAVALDTFGVSFGGRPVPLATCRQLTGALLKVLAGETDVRELLVNKGKDPERSQQFYQFSYLEGDPGILEFRAPRGRGMAYRLSRLIAKQGWNIVSARVGQWAGRGAAAFYVVGQGERRLSKSEVETALSGQV